MNFGTLLCVTFTLIWSVLVFTGNDTLLSMLLVNAGLQIMLFILVAAVPYLKTGRMSYVDIAWPFGVALIGVLIIVMGDGSLVRRVAVGAVYLLIGLRMGLGAVTMGMKTGVIFQHEFPRYVYRRMMLEQSGSSHIKAHSLAEIMAQGFANASVLALPGFMLAVNASDSVSWWEVAGLCIWLTAYALESTADLQKLRFMANNKGGVCNVGLWRFSRHPNYFAEWLVWTGLVVAAVPSWLALADSEATLVWAVMGLGALGASAVMYTTLVYLTGATPAEYYSVRKRPDYARYQQQTNMFFPWFPRTGA
ncbi:DUF1295 domain-containing protein [Marinobacter salinisoli]|uniref:DUF1295 domain-containing protein n=1 Tax=Marinobacter salinisoli TaxID=2769486 RepID=A0ABX7MW49_9GAMM|nr:DUF1295 domain-containing protein [Marinobacter salinisoli]QSP95609.1 DUF1295 domain-containing protein [Marinobacter salinisoli]